LGGAAGRADLLEVWELDGLGGGVVEGRAGLEVAEGALDELRGGGRVHVPDDVEVRVVGPVVRRVEALHLRGVRGGPS
jgi:hypothetical protein